MYYIARLDMVLVKILAKWLVSHSASVRKGVVLPAKPTADVLQPTMNQSS